MIQGINTFLITLGAGANAEVLLNTPRRFSKALEEMTNGYNVNLRDLLSTGFIEGRYDEMVKCLHIPVRSICEHHLLPIIGEAHFAYIPRGKVVGLSKIPRFIDALAHRLQLQERLTVEIVDSFFEIVQPYGCAVRVTALHCCIVSRGVEVSSILTTTDAMRGSMKTGASRDEWLGVVPSGLTIL